MVDEINAEANEVFGNYGSPAIRPEPLDDLPDNCLELIAQLLASKESSEDITNFALTCRKLHNVADHVMNQEKNKPPILRIEYNQSFALHPNQFTIVVSKRHWKYQKFDSIRNFIIAKHVAGGEKFMLIREGWRRIDHSRITALIPSVEAVTARVETAKDISEINSFLGRAAVDTFSIDTSDFDEGMKNAVLEFYEHRKARVVDITSRVLLNIDNFELAVSLIVERVDVTFRVVCVYNGITRQRWDGIFQTIIEKGGRVVVDGVKFPYGMMVGGREHVVCLSLPNR